MEEAEPSVSGVRPSTTFAKRLGILLVLFFSTSCRVDEDGRPKPSPIAEGFNLLLITLDTTRADALSCYGGKPGTTPNLDRIAEDGCRFLQSYSTSNATNPSHLSLLTGLHALDHGVFSNFGIPKTRRESLPSMFRRLGYETAGFPAAAHLAGVLKADPWTHFDTEPEALGRELLASRMSESFLNWSRGRNEDSPFFAWLHFFDPHATYEPPYDIGRKFYPGDPRAGTAPRFSEKPYFEQVQGARRTWIEGIRDDTWPWAMYLGEVHFMDREIGRVLNELESRGQLDQTVVVIVGDHGEAVDHHELLFTHAGLFEDTIHVPFLIRVPRFPAGIEWNDPVSHIDLVPTLAELFGLKLSEPTPGKSLAPILRGESPSDLEQPRPIFFEGVKNNQIAVRRGKWKLILPLVDDHRLLSPDPLLFDLEADPQEAENRFQSHPKIASELETLVSPWLRKGAIPRLFGLPKEEILKRLDALGYTR